MTRNRTHVASMMARLGEAGLAAATALPGLLAELDQHAAAVLDALGRDGSPPAPQTLARYAEGVYDAATGRGWRAPEAGRLDWARADWAVLRLVAITRLARSHSFA